MIKIFVSLFKGWKWGDYFQLVHSLAFVFFGFLILVRLKKQDSSLGYVVGLSFLFFGLYRLRLFIDYFSKMAKEQKKDSLLPD